MRFLILQAIFTIANTALANYQGFNYAAQGNDYASFHNQFSLSRSLSKSGTFSSARLYTMIQEGTDTSVIEAIPAAKATQTKLLLGLWASVDADGFSKELRALDSAMSTYGQDLRDIVIGISVGSEDLYRSSVLGASKDSGAGQDISVLLGYIQQVRDKLKHSVLHDTPVGHVDTLDAYTNHTNSQILEAVDFVGLNIFPYFNRDPATSVDAAADSFWKAYESMLPLSLGKPVWITETGWPTVDPSKTGGASPGVENAAKYWSKVACELQARCINFWWYILADPAQMPFFGVTNLRESSSGSALYNLDCGGSANCSNTRTAASVSTTSKISTLYQTLNGASPARSPIC